MNHAIIRKIEEQITRELLLTANDAGWPCVGYDYGDGFQSDTDYESTVAMCMDLDDVYLVFESPNKTKRAWVRLVYGNSGDDLICDNSITEGFEEAVMNYMTEYCENIAERMFA